METITQSDDLYLRYYANGDEEPLYKYTSDLELSKYLARKPHESESQTKEMLQSLSVATSLDKLGKCIWVIESVSSKGAIGYLTLIEKGDTIELHIGIIGKHLGRANASNAIKLACKYLLEELKYDEIVSFTDVENLAAQKAFQKAGFSIIKEIKNYYIAPQQSISNRDVYWLLYGA